VASDDLPEAIYLNKIISRVALIRYLSSCHYWLQAWQKTRSR